MKTTILLLFTISGGAYAQTACDQLKSLSLPDTTFSTVVSVAAGPYKAPGQNADGGGAAPGRAGRGGPQGPELILPAYCRVAATLKPSADSDIRMEVWMPENW